MNLKQFEVWLFTGNQQLYGSEELKRGEVHSQEIGALLNKAAGILVKIVFKLVAKTTAESFRLFTNEVKLVSPDKPLRYLLVSRPIQRCKPDFKAAVIISIYASGARHTASSQAVTAETVEYFTRTADIEFLTMDGGTALQDFQLEPRDNGLF